MIADLGCGDAALARALVPKGMTVLSFDLVSDNAYVIEADTCVRVPLPGSEIPLSADQDNATGTGEGQVVDVVVCALSLMGTNWPGCIREAWRILKAECARVFLACSPCFSLTFRYQRRVQDRGSH